jgi:phosphomannomutase
VQCSPHGFYARGKLPGSHLVCTWAVTLTSADDLTTEKLAMVASTVSSKMIQQMAHQEGFMFVECLTGAGLHSQLLAKS